MDLPISSKYRSTPNEPVTDEERNQLSTQLNDSFAAGHIGQEQYHQLLDQVFGADRLGDLVGVVEVLGKPATHAVPDIVARDSGGRPGELAEARQPAARSTLALVGGVGVIAVVAVIVLLLLLL